MPKTPKQAVEELLASIPESERENFPTAAAMVATLESVFGKDAQLMSLDESGPYFPKPATLVARGEGRMTKREAGAVLVDLLTRSGHLKTEQVGDGVLVYASSIKALLERVQDVSIEDPTEIRPIKCVVCGSLTTVETTEMVGLDFGGWAYAAAVPKDVCTCGWSYWPGEVMMRFEQSVALALIDTPLNNGIEFSFLRKSVGIPRAMFAEAVGRDKETIQRIEDSNEPPEGAVVDKLKQMVRERITIKRPYGLHRIKL